MRWRWSGWAWALAALSVLASASAAAATPLACDPAQPDDTLTAVLHRFDDYSAGFDEKMRTGYYRSGLGAGGPFGPLAARESLQLLNVRLRHLSQEAPTGLLVVHLDPTTRAVCTVLVSPIGRPQVHASVLPPQAIQRLRASLGVEARARGPLPRTAGVQRKFAGLAPAPAATLLDRMQLTGLGQTLFGDLPLGRYRRLLLLTGDEISRLPLAALQPAGAAEPLGVTHALVQVPNTISLTNTTAVRPPGPPRSALVIGDPDLSGDPKWSWPPLAGARAEAEAVADRLGATLLVGPQAGHAAVTARVRGKDYIHLATHALSDGVNPMDASLVALSGANLMGREIKSLSLSKDLRPLVVLSACQTGLGKVFTGGTFGPVRAWYVAGASQVVATLWSVEDDGTADLMRDFVEEIRAGQGTEFALRDAMRASRLRRDDPAVWASFYVFGEPSAREGVCATRAIPVLGWAFETAPPGGVCQPPRRS